jgi:hypothetical protein
MAAQYFGRLMVDRQLLFWTVTTRRQLERWEVCVAELVSLGLQSKPEPGQLVWRGEAEHHFMFLAARNLVRAAEVAAESLIETSFAETLKDVRDLLEHWDENMPIFNGNSKEVPPRPSGKRFAARNPTGTPYWSSEWNSKEGPLLFPKGPPAAKLHDALDRVQSFVVQRRPELMEYIPERSDQPWLGDDWGKDRWCPNPAKEWSTPRLT